MIIPFDGTDGSIYGSYPCSNLRPEGEWIELYNPNACEPVDISGYILGNGTEDLNSITCDSTVNVGASFVIPDGTIIPPKGFCVVRGINAAIVPPNLLVKNGGNTIEITVNNYPQRVSFSNGATRFWMPDAGSWMAVYNNNGIVQDAISWSPGSNIPCADCVPSQATVSGTYTGSLSSLTNISSNKQKEICTDSINSSSIFENMSLSRIPDGGDWQVNQPFLPSIGRCNSNCVLTPTNNCNGTATITVTGGSGIYTYRWSDALHQTTATAKFLCGGTYNVYVTDIVSSIVQMATVSVDEDKPLADAGLNKSICFGDSVQIGPSSPVANYTYQWSPSNTLSSAIIPNPNAKPTVQTTYNLLVVDNSSNCSNSAEVTVNVNPQKTTNQHVTICQGQSYSFGDTTITTAGIYSHVFQTSQGCDSTVVLNLSVANKVFNTVNDSFCDGDSYSFDGNKLTTPGIYTGVFKTSNGCDSIVTLNLSVKTRKFNTINEEICQNKTYTFGGKSRNIAGTYTDTLTAANGCDSINILHLTVNPRYNNFQTVKLLWGTSYDINGKTYTNPGVYMDVLNTINGCDSTVITNLVRVYTDCPDIVIPKFFTPNGDGVNDFFEIENIGCYPKAFVEIHDRFSKLLIRYSGSELGWDGTYLGKPMPSTDYWYLIVIPETAGRFYGHFLLER